MGTIVIHPAEIILDEMRERGWDIDRLASEMVSPGNAKEWGVTRLSWEMYLEVREPYVLLGDHMAGQLKKAFGVDTQFFLNLHENWRKYVTRVEG